MQDTTMTSNALRAQEVEAMNNCEKQVLHKLAHIQPYGYLLAYDLNTLTITHASQNCSVWFDQSIDAILGKDIFVLFPHDIAHACNNAAAHSTISSQREHVGTLEKISGLEPRMQYSDVFVHVKGDYLIVELQPISENSPVKLLALDGVHRVLSRLGTAQNIDTLLSKAVEELRCLTGFHRVMAYQFLPDGAGEVVAESKEPLQQSFFSCCIQRRGIGACFIFKKHGRKSHHEFANNCGW